MLLSSRFGSKCSLDYRRRRFMPPANAITVSTWTAQKFELFAKFKQLARRMGYVLFTADVRDYLLYGSGNSCLVDVPLNQKGALKRFAGKRIRLVCGGKSNRYSGRFYYAKAVTAAR
jgi:hypothetical protein